MSKSKHVLRALKILGLEEILKLSEVLQVKQVPLQQAAGGEFIVWDETQDEPGKDHSSGPERDAKVLEFPKRTIRDIAPLAPATEDEGGETPTLVSSDLVLWQREITRQTSDVIHKKNAFKGYQKSTEIYLVRSPQEEGKSKIRFADTEGVLVNKKQA